MISVAKPVQPGIRTLAVLAVWFTIVFAANRADVFITAPEQPPLALVAALTLPLLAFSVAYRLVPAFRDYVLGIDLRLLTALQGWRMIGAIFVALHAHQILPGLFAYPAGYGDMLVGLLAPFALLALIEQKPGWRGCLIGLNILGLVDFVVAVGTGLLTSRGPLGVLVGDIVTDPVLSLPVSLIPTFAVPLWTIIHIMSLLQLGRNNPVARLGMHQEA